MVLLEPSMGAKMERASLPSMALSTKTSSRCPWRWGWREVQNTVTVRAPRRYSAPQASNKGSIGVSLAMVPCSLTTSTSGAGEASSASVRRRNRGSRPKARYSATPDASPRERFISMASSSRRVQRIGVPDAVCGELGLGPLHAQESERASRLSRFVEERALSNYVGSSTMSGFV